MASQDYYGQSQGQGQQGYGQNYEGTSQRQWGSADYNQGYPPQPQSYGQPQHDQYGQANHSPYPPVQVSKFVRLSARCRMHVYSLTMR